MNDAYPRLQLARKSGLESFHRDGTPIDASVNEFWKWSESDLVSNATRGVLAEYLVALALGLADGVRAEWDAYDLRTPDGTTIEVKSAAYLQSWRHNQLSRISFIIKPTRAWDAESNSTSLDVKRQADLYVFCVLNHKHKDTVDPLNLEQWDFYILATSVLDQKRLKQKTLALSSLLQLNPIKARFEDLAKTIHDLAAEIRNHPSRAR